MKKDEVSFKKIDENTLLDKNDDGSLADSARSRSDVSKAVVKRLPRYFRYLRELLLAGKNRVSSGELARMMGITASQIRQDFNCFGGFGQQGYGYNVSYLYRKISEILGVTMGYRAVIVGCGNLGRALTGSVMFAKRGVELCGIFDVNPKVIGTEIAGYTVGDMKDIETFCREKDIDIAILTIPRDAALDTAARLAHAGVRGLWNFTNIEINLSLPGVKVENVHMGDSLMMLCYELGGEE